MKKVLAVLLCGIIGLSIVGCGGKENNKTLEEIAVDSNFELKHSDYSNYIIEMTDNRSEDIEFKISLTKASEDSYSISSSLMDESNEDIIIAIYNPSDNNGEARTGFDDDYHKYDFNDSFNSGCTDDEVELLKNTKKQYESFLDKNDLTTEDLLESAKGYK